MNLRYPAKWTKGSFDVFCCYFWTEVSNKDMKVIWRRKNSLVCFFHDLDFLSGFVHFYQFVRRGRARVSPGETTIQTRKLNDYYCNMLRESFI